MGQSASSAALKATCAQTCKQLGDKNLSTVKVDLASIHPTLDALCKDCNDDCSKASDLKKNELVTDQENVPPNAFNAQNLHQLDQNDDASTAASTVPSVKGNPNEFKLPQLNLPNQGTSPRQQLQDAQDSSGTQALDLTAQQTQPTAPESGTVISMAEEGFSGFAEALELKVVVMEWNETQQGLLRQEEITIPRSSGFHSELKVADFKTLLKEQHVTDTDFKVLTTPRRLELGATLNGLKTLAESGIGSEGPELLLVDSETLRKVNSANQQKIEQNYQKAAQSEAEQKKLESKKAKFSSPQSEVQQTKASPRNPQSEVDQKTGGPPKPRTDEEHKVLIEQQMKVEAWLKSVGFKDVNELARKQLLTKTRPLHVAVQKGDIDMIKLLILMGADPHLCNGKKETPLEFAKRNSLLKGGSAATYLKVATALAFRPQSS